MKARNKTPKQHKQSGQKKEKAPWSFRKKIIFSSAMGLALVLLVLIGQYVYALANPAAAFKPEDFQVATPVPEPIAEVIEAPPTLAPTLAPDETPSPTPSPTPDPNAQLIADADMSLLQNRLNIMILGLDESPERANWGSYRTDTMILLSINFEQNDVDMISIPRDSYVKIYGSDSRAKVNSAFSAGGGKEKKGFEFAMKTISGIFGDIPINYYIGFNMQVVKDVVNAMGGVDYEVDINVKMNGRTLSPGLQHLDGQQVLDYARQRKGSSDIARVDRQQRIILAVFKQMADTKQLANIPKIFTAVEKNLYTNLDFTQISALALFSTNLSLENIDRHTLGGDFLNMRKTSYWGVSEYKKQQLAKEIFGVSIKIDPDGDVAAIKRELEAQREMIRGELNLAQSLIGKCKTLLESYSGYLTADEAAALNNAIGALQDAYDMEEKDDLDAANSHGYAVYNAVAARIGVPVEQPVTDPNQQFVTPDPNQQGITPDPNQQLVTPDPNQQGVTPDPNQQGVTPDPNQQGVTPDPNQQPSQPAPTISFGNVFDQ